MDIQILMPLVERGYAEVCADLKELVMRRIEVSSEIILADYISEDRGYVDEYCASHNIDLVNVLTGNKEYKKEVGLKLIECEIFSLLDCKKKYDSEIKQLGISPIRITNGLENAPWFALFNNPDTSNKFTHRSNKFIDALDSKNKWYEPICELIQDIRNNKADPELLVPKLDDYWELMQSEVPDEVKDLMVKISGN
jgi:hypothetical protein